MRKSIITGLIALIASTANAADQHQFLTGRQLHEAVSGRTIFIQTPIGTEIPIRYRANGTMYGSSSLRLAALAGESVNKDKGRWWVRGGKLCQKWSKWSDARAYCYKLSVKGNSVYWMRNDGKTGTARLAN